MPSLHVWRDSTSLAENKTNVVLSIPPCSPTLAELLAGIKRTSETPIERGWHTPTACPEDDYGNDSR